jgi:hypothetical protein
VAREIGEIGNSGHNHRNGQPQPNVKGTKISHTKTKTTQHSGTTNKTDKSRQPIRWRIMKWRHGVRERESEKRENEKGERGSE